MNTNIHNITVGMNVRSYDFKGKDDCYVEGTVKAVVKVGAEHRGNIFGDCDRYAIKVVAHVVEGKRRECSGSGDVWAYPPVNGTPTYFGKEVTNGVVELREPTVEELREQFEQAMEGEGAPLPAMRKAKDALKTARAVVAETKSAYQAAMKVEEDKASEYNVLERECHKVLRKQRDLMAKLGQAHVEKELLGQKATCKWYDDEKYAVVKVSVDVVVQHTDFDGEVQLRTQGEYDSGVDNVLVGYCVRGLEFALLNKKGEPGKRTYWVSVDRQRYGSKRLKMYGELQWDGAGRNYRKFELSNYDLPDYWTAAGVPVVIPEAKEE